MSNLSRRDAGETRHGAGRVLSIAIASTMFGLSLAFLIVGIRYNLVADGPSLMNRVGNPVGSDFIAFYAAAVTLWREGAAAVYDVAGLAVLQRSILGYEFGAAPWLYPPIFLLVVAPLATLPYLAALWLWLGAMMAAAVAALWRLIGRPAIALSALVFPGVVQSIISGQTGLLVAALIAGGLAALPARPVVAGLILSATVFKPHIVVLVPLCLIAGGHWRAGAAMVVGGLVFALVSVVVFGLEPWLLFVAGLPDSIGYVVQGALPLHRMPTMFVAILDLTGDQAVASAAQAASTLVALAACVFVWRRSGDMVARTLVLAAAIPLATPYTLEYDLAVLVIPVALLVRRIVTESSGRMERLLLAILWVAPVGIPMSSKWIGQQIGPLVLIAFVAVAIGIAIHGHRSTVISDANSAAK